MENLPSPAELKERFVAACRPRRTVDWDQMTHSLAQWLAASQLNVPVIRRVACRRQLEQAEDIANKAMIDARFHPSDFAKAVSEATSLTDPPAHWDHSLFMHGNAVGSWRNLAARGPAVTRDGKRNQFLELAEQHEEFVAFAREKRALSHASAANSVRTARLSAVMAATRGLRTVNLNWNGRVLPDVGGRSAWDVSAYAISAIDNLELGGTKAFSVRLHLFTAFEAGAFCLYLTENGLNVCPMPSDIRTDDQGRLHSEFGPAFIWLNDVEGYYWHGVQVPSYVVDTPRKISVPDILSEPNAELRRIKLERYGLSRFLVDSHAVEIHRDEYGILYVKAHDGKARVPREPIVMVKVVNATPEPDGSFKEYVLRVPPTMRTAHEAVAWTFGKTPAEYHPSQQT
jgi:hypothetical protein